MDVRERWTRYCLELKCKACGEEVYPHAEDARADVDHILSINDFGRAPDIHCLRDALSWFEHEGEYCDYHTHMLAKDD